MKGLKTIAFLTAAVLLFGGCDCFNNGKGKERKLDKVLIFYMAGFNSLSEALLGDIDELKQGNLPAQGDNNAILIVGLPMASRPSPASSGSTRTRKGSPSWTRFFAWMKGIY